MFAIIRKILDLLSAREKLQLYLLFVSLAVMACIEMVGIASIMPFMAVVASPNVINTNKWLKQVYGFLEFSSLHKFLFFLGMLVLGLLVFINLFKTMNTWLILKYDNWLINRLSSRLLASYLNRPYDFFLNRNTNEMGKNLLLETNNVIMKVLDPGRQVLSNVLVSFFILVLLFVVNPFIATIAAVVLGGSYAIIYLITHKRMVSIGQGQFEANALKYKAATEALAGIKDLKILGREMEFLARYVVHAQHHAQSNISAGVISQLPRYALETIAFGGILIIILINLGSEETVNQMIPLLALYAFAGYRLLPALQQIFSGISTVRVNLPALEVLHQDMREGGVSANSDIVPLETKKLEPLPLTHELELKNVTFSYPGAKGPSLQEISLTITPNTSIGFVGATGSGKTTAADIILGLLSPTSGQIMVDGMDIRSDNLASWQRNVGYVPQHIYLCDDTITHNIAFGVPEKEFDMAAVVRAARIANLNRFIENELPDGFETVIGERGVRLSGGQRQRIGIARALYHDPAVLIMDEATSALDGITEEAVMEALRNLSGKKTIITIAHRLTTVKDCDVIYLMEQGRIVNQGTYDELLKYSLWFQTAARMGS